MKSFVVRTEAMRFERNTKKSREDDGKFPYAYGALPPCPRNG